MDNQHNSCTNPKNHFKAAVAVVLGFLLIVTYISIVYIPNRAGPVEEGIVETRLNTLSQVRAEQAKNITGYRWVDKTEGVVQVPIEHAMKLVVNELSNESLGESS